MITRPPVARALSLAERGEAQAQYRLGQMYFFGQGVPKEIFDAVRWFRKAAEQGHAPAQTSIGYMREHGYGLTENKAESARWYRKAAGQGYAPAQGSLGRMYRDGDGVPQSYDEALRWLRKAVARDNPWAVAYLGEMYRHGKGVQQNQERGVDLVCKGMEPFFLNAKALSQGQYSNYNYIDAFSTSHASIAWFPLNIVVPRECPWFRYWEW